MIVEVTKDNVLIKDGSVINSGEICVNKCNFILPECFEGLQVTAIFNGIPVPLLDGECYIPSLEKGNAVLGVYAYRENGNSPELMYSPKPTGFYVSQGSYCDEISQEAVHNISQYEQYCKMIADRYTELEGSVKNAEAQREASENERKNDFEANESLRQAVFEANENSRNALSNGAYTNLLKDFVDDNGETSIPTIFPCRKKGAYYNNDIGDFVQNAEFDCYIFRISPGDRMLVSGYTLTGATSGMASVIDKDFKNIYSTTPLTSKDLLGGIYVMPKNSAFVVLNTPQGSGVPNITLVDEEIIKTKDSLIPDAAKFVTGQMNGGYKLAYSGQKDGPLNSVWNIASQIQYANGIYPIEQGKEYVIYIPRLNSDSQYYNIAFFCDENFNINRVINHTDADPNFDENNKFIFVPSVNDKYIAINTPNLSYLQFGENRAGGISKAVNIGESIFDGKHNITLKDMGIIDRSVHKKLVTYGDSITLGAGINYARGEKRWQDYLIERYKIPSCINMGVGYSSLAMKQTYSELPMCHNSRLDNLISEAPDIVTILGGANDYIFGVPVGTYEDMQNENIYTFKGAYAYIIERILSAKPDTIILLLGMFINTMGLYGAGKGKYPLNEYATATKAVAEHYGLPFVDLNECGFNSYNFNTTNGIFSTDGIHPNKEGAKRIAMVLSKWFDSFNGTVY